MGGDKGDAPATREPRSRGRKFGRGVAIFVTGAVVVAGAVFWSRPADDDRASAPNDTAPSWVAGYVASPQDTEVIVVLEACEGWNLDEWWTMPSEADRVEVYIGWWSMSLPECEAPELRTITVGLSEPLGDRRVFISGGGEIPPFEGALPLEFG